VRLSVLLSIGFFLAGVGGYLLAPADREARSRCFQDQGENEGRIVHSFGRSVWPPGVACGYREVDGDEVSEVKTFGAGAWIIAALLCGAAGTATAFGVSGVRARRDQGRDQAPSV
jgi:hypothetical protein